MYKFKICKSLKGTFPLAASMSDLVDCAISEIQDFSIL